MHRLLAGIIGIILLSSQIAFSDVTPVKYLTGKSEAGQPHLYWFGAAAVESTLFYDDGAAQESIYVAEPWADNQILVRFGINAPFFTVTKLLARVSKETPSDTDSYFAFTLRKDTSATRPGPVLLQAPAVAHWNGQSSLWSEAPINILMAGDTAFWGALNWLESSPTKPRIGDDRAIDLFFRTYIGYQNNFFLWTNGGNLMLRAKVLVNSASTELADSFWVYRLTEGAEPVHITTTGPGQFDYVDSPPSSDDYYYQVSRWEGDQESQRSNLIGFSASPTAVEDRKRGKHALLLSEPFPNPTSAGVLFTARTDKQMELGFSIYNLLGQKVFFQPMADYPAGEHQFFWNGQDVSGRRLPSGLYLLRFQAGEEFLVKKATLLR